MVLIFVIGFAVGLGAVVWVLMSEILPTKLRAKAMSLFLSINWFFNFLIGFLTLSAINGLGNVE
jgi:MFS family permease